MSDTAHDRLTRQAPATRAKEREQRKRVEKSQEQADIATVMQMPAGRRLVHRVLETAGVHRTSYTRDDPHHTSFQEGQRNIGNWLLAQVIGETPDEYALMMKETRDETD